MNKRIALGVGGAVLLALGLVIGMIVGPSLQALAAGAHPNAPRAAKATPNPNAYCQLYLTTVSHELGKSESDLESANKVAMQAVIDKMYADGTITQAQKAQAEQELSQYASDPCAALQAMASAKSAHGSAATSGQAQAVKGARAALLTAVAGALHTSSDALQSELSAGKTVAQVTSEKGASKSAVDSAYLQAAKAQLAKAVSDGALSQTQSDLAYTMVQQSVSSGHYPLLDADNGSFGASLPAGMMSGQ